MPHAQEANAHLEDSDNDDQDSNEADGIDDDDDEEELEDDEDEADDNEYMQRLAKEAAKLRVQTVVHAWHAAATQRIYCC